LNKSIKIWANYLIGSVLSILLLYTIYQQLQQQLTRIDVRTLQHGSHWWLAGAIVLMLVNLYLESRKWHMLLLWAAPVRYRQALASFLAGTSFSIITPNRTGEYPGRILYLGGGHTFRYINVSVSGILSQLASIWFWGMVGLVYYNMAVPATMHKLVLAGCIIINIIIAVVYWRLHSWLPAAGKSKYLRRFAVYMQLLSRVAGNERMRVLAISLFRGGVFTAQYLFLLQWMNVQVPLLAGFCLSALFFWLLAVIPSFALTELGVRGAVSLYVFHHFSTNTVGLLAATGCLWFMNLIIPSVAGSILIWRMKWVKED
jgi:hypothetical protein